MQIVIEIQEDDFEKIRNTSFVEDPEIMLRQSLEDRKDTIMLFRVIDAIKDGTPLPKHGILIDADATGQMQKSSINIVPKRLGIFQKG